MEPDAGALTPFGRWAVVGDGRVGNALVDALPGLHGPFGRGFDGVRFDVVVLAVPDDEIALCDRTRAIARGEKSERVTGIEPA